MTSLISKCRTVELSNTKRISIETVNQIAEAQGIDMFDRTVGQIVPLDEGDEITLGNLFLTNVGKSVLSEDGSSWATGCYWVSECDHKHGSVSVKTDVADAAFARGGKKFPSLEEKVTVGHKVEDNLGGFSLYEEILKTLTPAQQALNLDLSRQEPSVAKLSRLKGHTFRVIKRVKAYRLRQRPKDAGDDWGSKPSQWRPVYLLFFEEVTAAPAAPSRGRTRNSNK